MYLSSPTIQKAFAKLKQAMLLLSSSSPSFKFYSFAFLVVLTVVISLDVRYLTNSEDAVGVLIEAHGFLLDILLFGLLWQGYEHWFAEPRRREMVYRDTLEALRYWESDEAMHRNIWAIRKLSDIKRDKLVVIGSYLKGAIIQNSKLDSINFAGLDMSETSIYATVIQNCHFSHIEMKGFHIQPGPQPSIISNVEFRSCGSGGYFEVKKFVESQLQLDRQEIDTTKFLQPESFVYRKTGVVLDRAFLYRVRFYGSHLASLFVRKAPVVDISFEHCLLQNSVFESLSQFKVTFKSCLIIDTKFDRCDMDSVEIVESIFVRCEVRDPIWSDITEARLRPSFDWR